MTKQEYRQAWRAYAAAAYNLETLCPAAPPLGGIDGDDVRAISNSATSMMRAEEKAVMAFKPSMEG